MKHNIHTLDVVFALVLFAVFTVSVLMVLMTGVTAYRNVAHSMQEQYEERTILSYISAKVHHYDAGGAVYPGLYQGTDVLYLDEEIDGTPYTTMLYYYDGAVRELFTQRETELSLDAGFEVLDAQALSFTLESDQLIRVDCTGASGNTACLYLSIHSQGGAT